MNLFIAFLVGCIFSSGLVLSGMTDTEKVRGFLDIFGAWNPTLAFVMAGALIPMFMGWRIAGKMESSVCAREFPESPKSLIDRKLLLGAGLFGIGWGLAGFCPGPALSSLSFGGSSSFIFTASMLAAMLVFELASKSLAKV